MAPKINELTKILVKIFYIKYSHNSLYQVRNLGISNVIYLSKVYTAKTKLGLYLLKLFYWKFTSKFETLPPVHPRTISKSTDACPDKMFNRTKELQNWVHQSLFLFQTFFSIRRNTCKYIPILLSSISNENH